LRRICRLPTALGWLAEKSAHSVAFPPPTAYDVDIKSPITTKEK
jgi:hypothetical protein